MGENELNENRNAGVTPAHSVRKPSEIGRHQVRMVPDPSVEAKAASTAEVSASAAAATAGATGEATATSTATTMDSVAAFTESAIEDRRKKRANQRRAGLVVAGVVAALLAIYLGGAAWFSGHFLPNTQIGSYDVSGMSADDAAAMFDSISEDYTMSVKGEGLDFKVTSKDTGLRIDSGKVTQKAIDQNNQWAWPLHVFGSQVQDLTEAMQVTFDESGFSKFVSKKVEKVNKTATDPTPANIGYKKKEKGFVVIPEKLGTKLDEDAVLAKVEEAAFMMDTNVEIGEDELLRPNLLADDKRLKKAVKKANKMLDVNVQLTLGGKDWAKVGSKQVASWIKLGDDVKPVLDDNAMYAWVDKKVAKVNTIGKERSYTTPRGESVTVSGGSYGWEVDYRAFFDSLKQAVSDRTKGELEVPCSSTAASLPDKNGVDFGSRYVDVNLSTQHAVFYDGKKVLWESDVISGSPDGEHNTPYGVYCVNNMESPSKLVGEMTAIEVTSGKGKNKTTTIEYQPEYETVVQYWMAFVGNGIGLHDATWQPGFGGSMYMDGYGSHGCVNLPYDAAEELYGIISVGTPVITHG